MKIEIADICFATKSVEKTQAFYARLLREASEEDHGYFSKLVDGTSSTISVVPHSGHPMWDHPWVCFGTDDLPAAIALLHEIGATDIQNSGPADADGNPVACVTFRDPDGRLMMLAT